MKHAATLNAVAALWCAALATSTACGKSDSKDAKGAESKAAKADAKANAPSESPKPQSTEKKKLAKASKTGADAKKAKQTGGSHAMAQKEKATAKGSTQDGLACDAELEGVAWCGSDSEMVFCAEGEWYVLDCAAVEDGSFCGTNVDDMTIDCWVDEDIAELVEIAAIDELVEDAAAVPADDSE